MKFLLGIDFSKLKSINFSLFNFTHIDNGVHVDNKKLLAKSIQRNSLIKKPSKLIDRKFISE